MNNKNTEFLFFLPSVIYRRKSIEGVDGLPVALKTPSWQDRLDSLVLQHLCEGHVALRPRHPDSVTRRRVTFVKENNRVTCLHFGKNPLVQSDLLPFLKILDGITCLLVHFRSDYHFLRINLLKLSILFLLYYFYFYFYYHNYIEEIL